MCSDGYFIENNTCLTCIEDCLECSNTTECHGCEGGHYVNENKTCSKCQENCVHCFSDDRCIECDEAQGYGRDNSTGDCVMCVTEHFV